MSRLKFYLLALGLLTAILGGAWALRRLLLGLPDIRALESYTPSLTTRVYDVKDRVAAEFSIERRALLPLSKIPVDLQSAVIAVEDDRFFHHWGISPKGIARALLANVLKRRAAQGASTITQQLALQIFLKRGRTFPQKLVRKMREWLLAVQIERNFSKSEILQFYLNQIYFGEGAYGVQAAARIFFGKEVSELSLSDCAMLAGVIRSPRANSPFVRPDNALRRRAVVLSRMLEEGMITAEEREAAARAPIPAVKPLGQGIQAPYFVEHIRQRLERRYGTNAIWRGGLKIYTTLDLDMQKLAEERMEKALEEFDKRALEEWERRLKEGGVTAEGVEVSTMPPSNIQGAFVLVDVKTGAVRAMIGGRDSVFNRAVQARRQPGSTFKAFVWAAALNAGMTAASLVDDLPLAYYYDGRDWRLLEGATDQYSINLATAPFAQSADFKIWVPNNFDGKFLGTITLRKALALSRNVASVRLVERIGPPLVADIARRAGVRSELDAVLSLGLGSSVVSPLELASAFGTFANGGIAVTPFTVLRVEDASGRQLESHVPSEREAMSPQAAYLITNMLKGVVAAGTATRAQSLRRPVAGKTGTTNDNRDLWFIGYTPDLVAGAWMGYDDFASLGRKDWTGGSTVLPWWVDIMEDVLKEHPKRDFPVPPGIVFEKIDSETGLLALPTCPRKNLILEAFREGLAPAHYCAVDHNKPVEAQLSPAASTAAGAAVRISTGPRAEDSPPPLPTDEELDQGPEAEEPSLLE